MPPVLPVRSYVPHFIGGADTDAASGVTFPVYNPATGSELTRVAAGGPADVDRAVAAAASAQLEWAALAPAERGRLLLKVADGIRASADRLALLDTLNSGRPISETSGRDVPRAAAMFEFFAGLPDKIRGTSIPVVPPLVNYTQREPYGVIGAITPWNYPLVNAVTKLAPILATGNAAVLKPAEQTPLTAYELARICREAGLPGGLVNVVHGYGPAAGAALVAHPGVPKIAFTGSTQVGLLITRSTGANVKSFTLELGGKSPNIVFADADLDQAAAAALFSVFMNQGQTCTAGTRLLVQESVAEAFLGLLQAKVRRLRVGDPLDPATHIGAIVSQKQYERVTSYVRTGLSEGAQLFAGGDRPAEPSLTDGYFLNPTIFTGVRPHMRIAQEEIFGPVLSVMTFRDEAEAVELGNGVTYGLAAAIWTSDLGRAHRLAAALKVGLVWINTIHALSPGSPYGGYKQSGVGLEMGLEAAESYMKLKSVWINTGAYKAPWPELHDRS